MRTDYTEEDLASLLELRRSGGRLSVVQIRALIDSPDLGNEERAALQAEIAKQRTDDPEEPPRPFTEAERLDYPEEPDLEAGPERPSSGLLDRLRAIFRR
jgi:hypothetical protein